MRGGRCFLWICLVLLLGTCIEGVRDHHGGRRRHHHLAKRLFVFGDSYVDTGNIWRFLGGCWTVPFGSTFPGKPTGRCSDGRVITDYIATYLGVPSPVPYRLKRLAGHRRRYGINFAYGGTGVFDTFVPLPNMTTQIDYLEQMIKEGTYRQEQLRSSMALVSVSGNDYLTYLLFNNGTHQGMKSYIPQVVNQTALDLQRLSRMGVGTVAVLGVGALGCIPLWTQANSYSSCIDIYNQDAIYHNSLLQQAVDAINPHPSHRSRVAVLDVYDAFHSMVQGHDKLGSRFDNLLNPCCVGTGPMGSGCGGIDWNGKPTYRECDNPGKSVFWDAVHPTQAAWSRVFQSLLPTLQQLFS